MFRKQVKAILFRSDLWTGNNLDIVMRVVTFVLPIAMNAAAPDGAPPRRIRNDKTALAPPCPERALRRGGITCRNESFLIFII
ncbi:MAG: hypothetical protein WB759_08405, partial [Methanoregula sp.]